MRPHNSCFPPWHPCSHENTCMANWPDVRSCASAQRAVTATICRVISHIRCKDQKSLYTRLDGNSEPEAVLESFLHDDDEQATSFNFAVIVLTLFSCKHIRYYFLQDVLDPGMVAALERSAKAILQLSRPFEEMKSLGFPQHTRVDGRILLKENKRTGSRHEHGIIFFRSEP